MHYQIPPSQKEEVEKAKNNNREKRMSRVNRKITVDFPKLTYAHFD